MKGTFRIKPEQLIALWVFVVTKPFKLANFDFSF